MNTKLLLIIGFSYFYGFFELALGLWQKRRIKVQQSSDKGTLWILLALIFVGFTLCYTLAFGKTGRLHPWDLYFGAGAFFVTIGMAIRIIAIGTLRHRFTYTVTGVDSHDLVDSGLYKYIRHPGYLGQILIFTGIALSLSNWLSMLGMVIPVLIGFLNRIRVEEKFLIQLMGADYVAYRERSWKLIPYVY